MRLGKIPKEPKGLEPVPVWGKNGSKWLSDSVLHVLLFFFGFFGFFCPPRRIALVTPAHLRKAWTFLILKEWGS